MEVFIFVSTRLSPANDLPDDTAACLSLNTGFSSSNPTAPREIPVSRSVTHIGGGALTSKATTPPSASPTAHLFHSMPVSYRVVLTASERSTCRGACKQTIAEGELRFGWSSGRAYSWFHLSCVKPHLFENAIAAHGSLGDIPGVAENAATERMQTAQRNAVSARNAKEAAKAREKEEKEKAEAEAKAGARATKQAEKEARAAAKQTEKEARAAAKQTEKEARAAAKQTEKDAKAAAKQTEKEAKAAAKQTEKEAKAAAKQTEKEAKAAAKQTREGGQGCREGRRAGAKTAAKAAAAKAAAAKAAKAAVTALPDGEDEANAAAADVTDGTEKKQTAVRTTRTAIRTNDTIDVPTKRTREGTSAKRSGKAARKRTTPASSG